MVTSHTGEGNDPHHIKGRGYGGSVKCSDLYCIPLRHDKHMELHNIGWQAFEQKYNIDQRDCVMAVLQQAYNDGVLKIEIRNPYAY